ncbi:hypothetical protein TrCOL_g261 [Triparma columacea]|uniref:Uncharacterized protein n=1 Tax=Triparma columacea TaxID=722753 RepID=A0A9W7L7T8_9STRA|nr:hypothetical protein TrCOL_g261 [Triparma columacea]
MDVTPEHELETFITSLVFSLGGSSSPSLVHPGVKRILSDAGHEYINTLGKSARRASTTESENTQQEYKRRKVVKVRDFLLPISSDGPTYTRAKSILSSLDTLTSLLSSSNGVLELLGKEEGDNWEDGDTKGEGSVNLLEEQGKGGDEQKEGGGEGGG